MDPVAMCVQYHTLSPWGHTAVLVREPPLEVRVAFAVGEWLQAMRFLQKKWLLAQFPGRPVQPCGQSLSCWLTVPRVPGSCAGIQTKPRSARR